MIQPASDHESYWRGLIEWVESQEPEPHVFDLSLAIPEDCCPNCTEHLDDCECGEWNPRSV